MLKSLTMQNIAIIDALSVDFSSGLTVITGETGSGKSILLDGIALAFGSKANSKETLKHGEERGSVELLFDLSFLEAPVLDRLKEHLETIGIDFSDDESELLLSRELTAKGSRSRLNGVPVAREEVEALRPLLIDLHGQHELTSLFDPKSQRQFLDQFGGEPVQRLKTELSQTYRQWQGITQQLQALQQHQTQWLQQQEFLTYQLQELEGAELSNPDEDSELQQQFAMLRHADQLKQLSADVVACLEDADDSDSPAVLDQLRQCQKYLSQATSLDAQTHVWLEKTEALLEETKALKREIEQYHHRVEDNPAQLQQVLDRLDVLEKLKKKYGPSLAEVMAKRETIAAELQQMETLTTDEDSLSAACEHLKSRLDDLAQQLSGFRQNGAESLQARMAEELAQLAMPGVRFEVALNSVPLSKEGIDEVVFLFSANPGEPLKPLAKVASGGELSRVLLALKVLLAERARIQTLVFDEIDTGIGGTTAKTLADKLVSMARGAQKNDQHQPQGQVLVITHQPIIAAVADTHLVVKKQIVKDAHGQEAAQVQVAAIGSEAERHQALAQMMTGLASSEDSPMTSDSMAAISQLMAGIRQSG